MRGQEQGDKKDQVDLRLNQRHSNEELERTGVICVLQEFSEDGVMTVVLDDSVNHISELTPRSKLFEQSD